MKREVTLPIEKKNRKHVTVKGLSRAGCVKFKTTLKFSICSIKSTLDDNYNFAYDIKILDHIIHPDIPLIQKLSEDNPDLRIRDDADQYQLF